MMKLYRYWVRLRSIVPARQTPSGTRPAVVRPQLEGLEPRLTPSSDLFSNPALSNPTPNIQVVPAASVTPAGLPGQPLGFSPQQISQAYSFNQISFNNGTVKGDGRGQTIAIVDPYSQPDIANDLRTFDSTYGLAAPPSFTVVNEYGGTALPTADADWGLEESLDVEWAHAMAPGAKILLVEAKSTSWSDLLTAVNYARQQPGVSVVSLSWGASEGVNETQYNGYFTTPSGHNGITFVAASGDSGSTGAPLYPSVSPNVLAVGGTRLDLNSTGSYGWETGWSGSGGGISAYESQPQFQKGIVTQAGTERAVPDVAYNASSASPYAVYDSWSYSGWVTASGTSAGVPQWAALIAIADQGRALNGAEDTLPALYQLPSTDFHDVTAGTNGAYSAGPGYDLVTGRGSPVANKVVSGLVEYGTPGTLPWVVKPATATSNLVTGRTAELSVLGGDYGGASDLTYTWWALSGPAGAPLPTYSLNGTNAAQNTQVTFYKAGTYVLRVTLENPTGKMVNSDITVTVEQTPTRGVTPGVAGTGTMTAVQPQVTWDGESIPPAANRDMFTARRDYAADLDWFLAELALNSNNHSMITQAGTQWMPERPPSDRRMNEDAFWLAWGNELMQNALPDQPRLDLLWPAWS
jgi:subtilase family serine protease